MASDRVNARLSTPLAEHVSRVTGENGMYETPSEYIRDLIRRDMQSDDYTVYNAVIDGFEDIAQGKYFKSSGNWAEDREAFEKKAKEG